MPTEEPVTIDVAGGPVDADLATPAILNGSIDVAFDERRVNFQGAAGQFVSGQITQMDDVCDVGVRWDFEVFVVDGNGNEVGERFDNPSCNDAFGPWELPADGPYSFVVAGAEGSSVREPTGTFQMLVGIQDRVTAPVDLAAPIDIAGGVTVGLDQQWFPFDAVAGDRVSVEVTMVNGECDISNRWYMELGIVDDAGNPIGELYDSIACNDAFGPWEMPADGRYSLVVSGGEGSSVRPPSGTYQIRFARLGG